MQALRPKARWCWNPWFWPLYIRVLIGVVVGAVLGSVFGKDAYLGGLKNEHLGELGLLVIRMLKALAGPLIFFAILDAFARTRISGRQGMRLLMFCGLNVSVAFVSGLVIMNVWQPGLVWRDHLEELAATVQQAVASPAAADASKRIKAEAAADRAAGSVSGSGQGQARPDTAPPKSAAAPPGVKPPAAKPTLSILENLAGKDGAPGYVPESLIEPFLNNRIITIVLLGILAGAALRRVKDVQRAAEMTSVGTVERFVEATYDILVQMLAWLVQLVPLAVLGAVAKSVGQYGLEVFQVLWVFLAAMLLGLGIHALVYYPLAAWILGRKRPREFLGLGAEAIVTGLSTNSSLATVPVTLDCLTRKMGVSEQSARLSACVGTNFNNDGIMLYEAMAALFLAQAVGFRFNLGQQLEVVLASVMAGVGIAGIPEAGLIVLPLVLGAAGLPEAAIAAALPLIIPVDWIIARCRSAVNVMNDMLVAILLDRDRQRRPGGDAADAAPLESVASSDA